jgi:hypothetical protein
VRSGLRKEGHTLPALKQKLHVKLGTKAAAAMKMIYYNPRVSSSKIHALLAKEGVFLNYLTVAAIKSRMKRVFGSEIDFSFKPEPVHLTAAQKKMIPDFKIIIGWALYKKILPSLNWPRSKSIEFEEFVNGHIMNMIKNYRPDHSKITTYVLQKARFLLKDFIRASLMSGTGLSRPEVNRLIRIIRERHAGKSFAQIAGVEKVPKTEIDELWRAYSEFLKTDRRQQSFEK